MARSKLRLLLYLIPALVIISILIIVFTHPKPPATIEELIITLASCKDSPGPNIASRTVDLDPSIPMDSKSTFVIKLKNGENVDIYFWSQVQLLNYLKGLNNIDCYRTTIPPFCVVGRYPGEPPGRKSCFVPTPSITP